MRLTNLGEIPAPGPHEDAQQSRVVQRDMEKTIRRLHLGLRPSCPSFESGSTTVFELWTASFSERIIAPTILGGDHHRWSNPV